MENKYYTPSIDEIYHKFDFEYIHPMRAEGEESRWISHNWEARLATLTLNPDYISIGGFSINAENIRVKCLDSSDIESILFDKDKFLIRTSKQNNIIQVCKKVNSEYENNGNHYVLFQGTIKNKSELSRLLKQLSII